MVFIPTSWSRKTAAAPAIMSVFQLERKKKDLVWACPLPLRCTCCAFLYIPELVMWPCYASRNTEKHSHILGNYMPISNSRFVTKEESRADIGRRLTSALPFTDGGTQKHLIHCDRRGCLHIKCTLFTAERASAGATAAVKGKITALRVLRRKRLEVKNLAFNSRCSKNKKS